MWVKVSFLNFLNVPCLESVYLPNNGLSNNGSSNKGSSNDISSKTNLI
jgi:plastocyanin domain-containing protein